MITHLYPRLFMGFRWSRRPSFGLKNLIRKMRGVLQVGDRKRLEQKACCCYGIIASAYEAVECPAQTERTAEASV
jgi:hypothetical protein